MGVRGGGRGFWKASREGREGPGDWGQDGQTGRRAEEGIFAASGGWGSARSGLWGSGLALRLTQ